MSAGKRNDPKPLPPLGASDVRRFHASVEKRGPDECWPWGKARLKKPGHDYGCFKAARRMLKANRVAYFLHHGVDPFPALVLHACDNPPCCNPAHLFVGTQDDNRKDCKAKGRVPSGDQHPTRRMPEVVPRGSRNGNSKLTEEKVRGIRTDYASGMFSQQALGEKYGVHQVVVGQVVRRVTWRHVP